MGYTLKGSTIIETIVALLLVSIVFIVSFQLIGSLSSNRAYRDKIGAQSVLRNHFAKLSDKQELKNAVIETKVYLIEQQVRNTEDATLKQVIWFVYIKDKIVHKERKYIRIAR
jgi:hypothetical protein